MDTGGGTVTLQADNNPDRLALMRNFLARNGLADRPLAALADDCSFRRYFRATGAGTGFVVMDAPPALEDVVPFVTVSRLLNDYGYSAPRILDSDVENGFLLLDDFGDATYTKALAAGADEYDLYAKAMDVLIDLHRRAVGGTAAAVPAYLDDKLLDEAVLFIDWYLVPGLGLEISADARDAYLSAWRRCLRIARAAADTLVLRDYHVDNLMVLDEREGVGACGLLDFQDAVIGPASYDVVSLLQDSRRDIPEDLVAAMLERYFDALAPTVERNAFMGSYRALGAQRALKVFGIFTRQSVLHGNHQYLVHIPGLWRHTVADLAVPELAPVRDWIDRHVPEALRITPCPGGRMNASCC